MVIRPKARGSVALALALALVWPTWAQAESSSAEPGPDASSSPSDVPEPNKPASAPDEPSAVPDASPSPDDPSASDGTDDPSPEQLAQEELIFARNEARRHFNEGERLFHAGLYTEAAVEFERSYSAVPVAEALYNAAYAYERASTPLESIRVFERYIKIADCNALPPEGRNMFCAVRLDDARELLEEQRRRVGQLTLKIEEGVELREIRVAGRSVPLDEFPLLLMPSTIDVELYGMGPDDRITRPAYITAGQVYEVHVPAFENDVIDDDVVDVPDPREDDRLRREQRVKRLTIAFYAGAGLTVASGVALGIMAGLTRYHDRRFDLEKCEAECYERDDQGNFVLDDGGLRIPKNTGYPHDHLAAAQRYQPVTNALIGVTVGLGVATALLGGFAFRKRDAERPPAGPARARVGLSPSGLVVRW